MATPTPKKVHTAYNSTLTRKTPLKKSQTPITQNTKPKPVSKKMQKDRITYLKLRAIFLASIPKVEDTDHPRCQIGLPGCTQIADQVHHTRGRGIYFLAVETFKATCDNCHRIVEVKPKMAKAEGHSASRLNINPDA